METFWFGVGWFCGSWRWRKQQDQCNLHSNAQQQHNAWALTFARVCRCPPRVFAHPLFPVLRKSEGPHQMTPTLAMREEPSPRAASLKSSSLHRLVKFTNWSQRCVCIFSQDLFFEVHIARSEGATWMCLLNELCRGSWMECGLGCRAGLRFMCMCVTDAHLSLYTLGTPLPGPVPPLRLAHPSSAARPLTLGHSADPRWASVSLTAT